MRLYNLHPIHKSEQPKRVGRGGKKGTYSGRGMKGQKARAGSKSKPRLGFAGGDTPPYKKIPKRRGFRFGFIRKKAKILINFGTINRYFKNGEKITPETLLEKGLIKKIKGKLPEVKILGSGRLAPLQGFHRKIGSGNEIAEAGVKPLAGSVLAKGLTKKLLVEGCQMSKTVKNILKF